MMKCSFVDVSTKRETKVELSMLSSDDAHLNDIEKFTVE